MLARMWRNGNPLALLVGLQTGAATLENNMEVPQKLEKELPYNSAITLPRYLSEGYRCAVLKGHMHPHVYSSAINKSQSMEMSIDG